MEEVVAEPAFISAFCAKAYDFLQSELEKKNADGHRIHIDACSLLEEWTVGMVPTREGEETGAHWTRALAEYGAKLKRMEETIAVALHGRPTGESPMARTVPNGVASCTLPLWSLGFHEHCSVKGASPSSDVVDCFEKFTMSGNETYLYPLVAHFQMNPATPITPGAAVEDFSVGLVMGFAVTLGCHLFGHLVWREYQDQCFSEAFWTQSDQHQTLATRLQICLRVQAKYIPKKDLSELVFTGISSKNRLGADNLRTCCSCNLPWAVWCTTPRALVAGSLQGNSSRTASRIIRSGRRSGGRN